MHNCKYVVCTIITQGRCSSDWNGFDGCAVAVATDSDDYCRSESAIAIVGFKHHQQMYA